MNGFNFQGIHIEMHAWISIMDDMEMVQIILKITVLYGDLLEDI